MPKNYKQFTGLREFYYGEVNEGETGIIGEAPERIRFLNAITVETPAEISRAHGDNQVAELATSNGPVTLSTTFHKLPMEDKARLLGLKSIGPNGFAFTPDRRPPYVACAFARTAEDGGTEWLGFAKGIFTPPSTSGSTKTDGAVDFGTDVVNAEFMPRAVEGIEGEESGTMFVMYDEAGSTAARDFLFGLIFGVPHPDAGVAGDGA